MDRKSVLVAAAVVLGGGLVWKLVWKMSATPEHPAASTGAPLVSVTVPALSRTAQAGKAAFDARCAECHGVNAAGQDGIAPPLVHKIYEPGHHGDISFQLAARNGVRAHHWPFGDMPPVEQIGDAEIATIVTYVRELQAANGIF
ncbi:cytochrome C [Hoeflea sp. BAL378]|uniref:c-type cytochrome n=1 Tax=Hoeflea sp. BAL378 TaxID=1547437 RepID=UPI0005145D2B|nr:cytochrome c [Hoeflea sp. BAL378]KGF70478.1 cytochrome C [Hoeflea sp. BAL378]